MPQFQISDNDIDKKIYITELVDFRLPFNTILMVWSCII